MRALVILLFLTVVPFAFAEPNATPAIKDGDVVFELNLADPKTRAVVEASGGVVSNDGPGGEAVLCMSNTSRKPAIRVLLPVDVKPLRGSKLVISGVIQADGVEALDPESPLLHYQGLKMQLYVNSAASGKQYFDGLNLHGTFAARSESRLITVPEDATEGAINLGIEKASGTARFSRIQVRVVRAKQDRPTPTAWRGEAPQTKYRGVMSPQVFRKDDFDAMASWKINLVRWQMWQEWNDKRTYDDWLAAELDDLALALDAAASHGIKVVIDLHSPPERKAADGTMRMFLEQPLQDQFVRSWEKIARRFKGNKAIYGYDLINEPVQKTPSPPELCDWLALQVKAARAIRAIDSETPVIIETDNWDSPDTFRWLAPVDIPHVIYQAHMYWPHTYTHQGVKTNKDITVVPYPGTYADRPLDKEALRRYLQPVRDFQLAYQVPIYIGEFSAIRWAPGADRYLDDLISIFEEYGWDWSYHAFREWDGWSVEHAEQPRDRDKHPKATGPTERAKVLQKWFSRNAPKKAI
ncbi:MAG: glycoside hydrolase family 5 protein [Candidatus Methylacidiphilales bacterium]|nr:cellulase family glycosylhydrolase [Candidatus Methylacidiphilales bacterium]